MCTVPWVLFERSEWRVQDRTFLRPACRRHHGQWPEMKRVARHACMEPNSTAAMGPSLFALWPFVGRDWNVTAESPAFFCPSYPPQGEVLIVYKRIAITILCAVFCEFGGVDGAEALGSAGSREHLGRQLSHLEAVDLPRKDKIGEDPGRAPPRAGKRNRPPVSEEVGPRGHRSAARKFPEDQREKPADWPRGGHQIQRPAGAGDHGDWGAAHYLDHHGGCRQGAAVEARGTSGGTD